ncbi:hydroxymethylglutaryl-CoA reductase, degradative [bacterium]|nr:hydroxymethylglutaryl-CoA reductase, degradative [bacterium]
MTKKQDTQAGNEVNNRSSRIPRFYRLPVERRLAYLQRAFNLTNDELAQLRQGSALRIDHAVNMVENAVGIFGLPLGLGLNFLVNDREYIVPMAIEEASIIAAVSKSALAIREGGGFTTEVDPPVMIGQVQVLELADPAKAAERIAVHKQRIIDQANLPNQRMVSRGGGVFDVETRIIEGGAGVGAMLIVHLLMDVREAMGANAVNSSCEAAGPLIAELTGGRVNLRILSNLADKRLARARFRLAVEQLATAGLSGEQVAQRMVEAARFAWADPYRATTHNKGIMNGIGAAAVALGQDWRAIEAGGHAYAARDGQYRSLTAFRFEDGCLVGEIELPMQAGWCGGAVNSHPGVRLLRKVSGVENAQELAGLLAAVGLAQNYGACLALSTVGIQRGHMALHARSVALSVGVPSRDVEYVAEEMLKRGEVKTSAAEEIFAQLRHRRSELPAGAEEPVTARVPGKVVLFGEHAVVYGQPGITSSIDLGLTVKVSPDPDGPRFVLPRFKSVFDEEDDDLDFKRFGHAVDAALELYGLSREPLAIEVDSEIVPGLGLGSSAAISAALCLALRKYRGLPAERAWDPALFEDVQVLERIFHGTPSGIDAATVLSGGVLWFRAGPPREILPIRMPQPAAGLVVVVEPGARTIELVRQVRQSFELNEQRTKELLDEIGAVTVQAGAALGCGDLATVGELMYQNHDLLARLGVSTDGLDNAVELLREHGALGAKLSGAGGGGAVVALVKAEERHKLVEALSGEFPALFPFEIGAPA